ncbi:TPM domain-containing protein [Flavobacterium amniphilum]|uniref:TPM domain-containing protein n=1 Tax=Flavobacterium amniphilum TaxID=1834035 RepID=UPI00202A806B|nr:TPM domain-containing protein [Flavobacterium amniphilum]MCL9804638.1 TPM domain-containing protein [Flavobacterium amniphilum]
MKKLFLFAILLFGIVAQAQIRIPEKPSFIPPVIDSTKTLSEIQLSQLYQKLKIYSDSTSTQVLVMMVSTTQGEDVARYATDLGQKWQIGQKGKDNGIIVLIAKDDRKITIQTGYGIEHLLTDALSRRIIEQEIKPNFKAGNFYDGIDQGTTAIFKVMKGEYKGEPKDKDGNTAGIFFFIFIVILFIIIFARSKGNRNGGRGGGGGLDLTDIIILSSLGRGNSGSSWGGSSGGSDWGGFGGGGSFGGGGASGDW